MGSGKRIQFWLHRGLLFGATVGTFPFALTVGIHFAIFGFSIGFGKGYDE